MPLLIDAFNKLVLVTSPTTEVSAQELHDFVEDYMASPVGMVNDGAWPSSPAQKGDILKPEGKIEDENNPGVFTQIILIFHPQWQVQFWAGSGYTRLYGGKFTGGVNGEVLLATGTAGDLSVLESQVDGTIVVSGSGVTQQDKDDIENQIFERLVEQASPSKHLYVLWLPMLRVRSIKLEMAPTLYGMLMTLRIALSVMMHLIAVVIFPLWMVHE